MSILRSRVLTPLKRATQLSLLNARSVSTLQRFNQYNGYHGSSDGHKRRSTINKTTIGSIGAIATALGSIELANCTAEENTTLETIKLICKNYIGNPKYVYKFCDIPYKHGVGYIVVLERLPSTKTNECRYTITMNMNYAKFRGSEFKVATIIDVTDPGRRTIHEVTNIRGTTYAVGTVVKPNYFDKDLNVICAAGIHYFKSIDAAFFCRSMPSDYTGVWRSFDEDGKQKYKITYANGIQMRSEYALAEN